AQRMVASDACQSCNAARTPAPAASSFDSAGAATLAKSLPNCPSTMPASSAETGGQSPASIHGPSVAHLMLATALEPSPISCVMSSVVSLAGSYVHLYASRCVAERERVDPWPWAPKSSGGMTVPVSDTAASTGGGS
ncbi:hypothetical protein BCR44DRAFT_1428694, partial [Catenaria anguillulae PL171]